jgi:hypothetical protein
MKLQLLGALLLPVAMQAGTLTFGSLSTTQLDFDDGDITWTGSISGTGSVDGIPLSWSISDSSDLMNWTGDSSPFGLSQRGNAITLSVNDGALGDTLSASLTFTQATTTSDPDVTDLQGTFSFSAVNIKTALLVAYVDTNFGGVPMAGDTGTFDILYSCGSDVQCVSPIVDPLGNFQSADLIFETPVSTTPEPGTVLLIGCGIAGLVLKRRTLGSY